MEDEEALARKLAFVRPERRALVERRIAVLERYLARERGDEFDADKAAAELGMARQGFFRLLRAWKETRDPVKAGVTRAHGPRGRQRRPGDDFIERTLAALPTGRPLLQDVTDVEAAARAAGVTIRGSTALTAMVRQLRDVAPFDGPLIDHVALAIPCAGPDGAVMPVATVLADGRDRVVHAIALRLEPVDAASAADVIRHAYRLGVLASGQGLVELAIDASPDEGWQALFHVLGGAGVRRTGANRRARHAARLARSLVFPALFGIPSHPKMVALPAADRPIQPVGAHDEVLTLDRAQRLIDEMVAAARGDARLTLGHDVDGLAAALDALHPD